MPRSEQPGWPAAWQGLQHTLAGRVELDVAGFGVTCELTPVALEAVYLPLLAELEAQSRERRIVVGLAGIPGGGKSTFAAVLQWMADRIGSPGRWVTLGLDGWHYPNAVLDARTTRDAEGQVIPLRERKGGPESFDVSALAEVIQALHTRKRYLDLPAYDRQRHDPVPHRVHVPIDAQIVLIEGNFLLGSEPPWDEVSRQFDLRCLLRCDAATARERILARHHRGGSSPERAWQRFEINDRLNIEAVLATAANAELCIDLEPTPGLEWMSD